MPEPFDTKQKTIRASFCPNRSVFLEEAKKTRFLGHLLSSERFPFGNWLPWAMSALRPSSFATPAFTGCAINVEKVVSVFDWQGSFYLHSDGKPVTETACIYISEPTKRQPGIYYAQLPKIRVSANEKKSGKALNWQLATVGDFSPLGPVASRRPLSRGLPLSGSCLSLEPQVIT
jgi:hypothetical protein